MNKKMTVQECSTKSHMQQANQTKNKEKNRQKLFGHAEEKPQRSRKQDHIMETKSVLSSSV